MLSFISDIAALLVIVGFFLFLAAVCEPVPKEMPTISADNTSQLLGMVDK